MYTSSSSSCCTSKLIRSGDRDDTRLVREELSHCRDTFLSFWRETSELLCLQEIQGVHRSQLLEHLGPARVVERPSEHLVSISEQLEYLEVTLMVTPRHVRGDAIEFIENAFAISLKSRLPELTENLPI